ncbi:MAG: FKBP-type peptidyl-prolyl cis-trans isomerase [Dehalococcoidia bacterium]|nr:FKBP-type peptidyl-prolyl cis-trans isomerase [Dehalococcoidia bacterium]
MLLVLTAALAAALVTACGDDSSAPSSPTPGGQQVNLDNPTVTPSGLKYVDEVVGTGASPRMDQTVTVHYTGKFASDGRVFDSSGSRDVSFPMNGVIKGFAEAISTMKVGGKRTAFIPSALGYGPTGSGPIPPNSDLVFEIELVAIR